MAENTPWDMERHGDDWFNITDRFGGSVAEAIPTASAARLIVAAPDMYAALRLIQASAISATEPDHVAIPGSLLHAISGAIAKAEGL